ncbi:MAG: hypothetical protein E7Z67_01315 [Thermoplasmata archaeon]|nr:hypothetical protein [Thermoplasmata archaeon]
MVTGLEMYERRIREFFAKPPFNLRFDNEQIVTFRTAMTHTSFAEEYNVNHEVKIQSYERLEFLGDAVLEFIVCDEAYKIGSLKDEGQMTNNFKQAAVANAKICEYLEFNKIDYEDVALLGRSFRSEKGDRFSDDMRADIFEAIIAAAYLTFGIDCARRLIQDIVLLPLMERFEF